MKLSRHQEKRLEKINKLCKSAASAEEISLLCKEIDKLNKFEYTILDTIVCSKIFCAFVAIIIALVILIIHF